MVQASDEFTQAVKDTENAGGQLDEMVRIQNESISAQIQILKNNVQAIFFMRDATFEGTEFMNAFHKAVVETVAALRDLIVIETENGYALTAFGQQIQDLAVNGILVLQDLLVKLIDIVQEFSDAGLVSVEMLELLVLPMKIFLEVLHALDPEFLKFIIYFKVLNSVLPVTQLLMAGIARSATAAQFAMGGGALGAVILGGMMLNKYMQNRQSGGYVQGMADGGLPMKGTPYIVGEQGPELFIPDTSGQILNTMQTQDTIGKDRTVMKNVSIGIDSFGGII